MNIQWFPGHMAKTRRILTEDMKMIDVVIELLMPELQAAVKTEISD